MPVNKINYGQMFVIPDPKRDGAYLANIPIVENNFEVITKVVYFGKTIYRYPKLMASLYVDKVLTSLYGEVRATYIRTIPQFIHRMKFGNQVSLVYTTATSRQVKYDVIRVCWSEFELVGRRYERKRKNKSWNYNATNKREVEHIANLFAAHKRAELTMSKLDIGVLTLKFDLDA